jgi:glycosyltransferase involved in cell wall biosynthesis
VSGGGCERWHCDISNELSYKHEVQIVTANLGPNNWTNEYLLKQLNGTPYTKLNFIVVLGALIPTPWTVINLFNKFISSDCIHVIHGFIGQDLLILLLKLLTKKKVVLGWHSPIFHHNKIHNMYMKYISRYLLNFFDGHMTLNRQDKKFLEEKWNIKNVYFIPSGVKTDMFKSIKKSHNKELSFVTVGHYRHQKGIDLALEGINKFNELYSQNKAKFTFVGSGEYGEMISEYSKKHKNIINKGFVKYENLPNIYQNSDIYLLPSREEPFGLVLIEAWSSGLPVIATMTEGPLDMLVAGKNGWFIKSLNPDSIFNAIEKVYLMWLKDSSIFSKMKSYCISTGNRFSIKNTALNMHNTFFKQI